MMRNQEEALEYLYVTMQMLHSSPGGPIVPASPLSPLSPLGPGTPGTPGDPVHNKSVKRPEVPHTVVPTDQHAETAIRPCTIFHILKYLLGPNFPCHLCLLGGL